MENTLKPKFMIFYLIFLYFKFLIGSVIGIAFQLIMKNMSQKQSASNVNVEYTGFWGFVKKDKKAIYGTLLTLALFFVVFGEILNGIVTNAPDIMKPYFWGYVFLSTRMIVNAALILLTITIAYSGQDIALRFLGRTNKELKDAIAYKAKQTDEANGTTDKPTPVK